MRTALSGQTKLESAAPPHERQRRFSRAAQHTSIRLKDFLGPVTRIKKKAQHDSHPHQVAFVNGSYFALRTQGSRAASDERRGNDTNGLVESPGQNRAYPRRIRDSSSSSSLLLSSIELSDATIYEPQIRALLGTAPHFQFARQRKG